LDQARQVGSSSGFYAALICAVLLIVAAAVVRLVPPDPAYLRATFTIEHVELLGMFDNRGQQWAHRVLMGLLCVLMLVLWLARPRAYPNLPRGMNDAVGLALRYGGIPLAIIYVIALVVEGRPWVGDTMIFQGRYALFPALSVRTVLLLGVFGLVLMHVVARIADRERTVHIATRLALVACAAYLLALVAFGVFRQPSFANFIAGLISGVEWHYSGSVSSGDRIAAGERLGEVPIHASVLGSVLLAIWQRAVGLLDFGGHIRLLAVLQVLMMAALALAYGAWYRGRPAVWLLAVLLVVPWIQPMQAAVLYPNQSGWRFLALAVGLAVLAFVHAARLGVIAPLLGFACGLALLWNPETGLVLNGAYVVFLVLRAPPPLWKAAATYAAGVAGALVAFALIARAGLGYWPDAVAVLSSMPLIGNFSKGYGGLPFSGIDPLALLVFAHALYVVARGILDWARGTAFSPRESATVALAALLVAWGAYYFKAPHTWNLWSSLMIYGFLLGQLVGSPTATSAWRLPLSPRHMLVAIVILPAIVGTNAMALASLTRAVRQAPCPEADVLSGICLPSDLADLLRGKAAALQALAGQHGRIVYFTANPYLMPLLSGIVQPLRQRDAFADIVFRSEFVELVSDVRMANPTCVLYDDPDSPLSGYEAHRKFYSRLRDALADQFVQRRTAKGWDVRCKKAVR
jgi:hypothetical protein